jgi:hypothetical protein
MKEGSPAQAFCLLAKVAPQACCLEKVALDLGVPRLLRFLLALGCSGSVIVGFERRHKTNPTGKIGLRRGLPVDVVTALFRAVRQ